MSVYTMISLRASVVWKKKKKNWGFIVMTNYSTNSNLYQQYFLSDYLVITTAKSTIGGYWTRITEKWKYKRITVSLEK